jgi:hypothetical protein
LGTIIAALGCSCKEKITVTVEQLKNPHLIVMSTCLSKLLPPVDIQTPEMFRSEEEQFVRHELIDVPPLPPPPLIVMNLPRALKQLLFIRKRNIVSIDRGKLNLSLENQVLKWSEIC